MLVTGAALRPRDCFCLDTRVTEQLRDPRVFMGALV